MMMSAETIIVCRIHDIDLILPIFINHKCPNPFWTRRNPPKVDFDKDFAEIDKDFAEIDKEFEKFLEEINKSHRNKMPMIVFQ